jgi:hypothetical protein
MRRYPVEKERPRRHFTIAPSTLPAFSRKKLSFSTESRDLSSSSHSVARNMEKLSSHSQI